MTHVILHGLPADARDRCQGMRLELITAGFPSPQGALKLQLRALRVEEDGAVQCIEDPKNAERCALRVNTATDTPQRPTRAVAYRMPHTHRYWNASGEPLGRVQFEALFQLDTTELQGRIRSAVANRLWDIATGYARWVPEQDVSVWLGYVNDHRSQVYYKEYGLSRLEGTSRQVAWALSLRQTCYDAVAACRLQYDSPYLPLLDAILEREYRSGVWISALQGSVAMLSAMAKALETENTSGRVEFDATLRHLVHDYLSYTGILDGAHWSLKSWLRESGPDAILEVLSTPIHQTMTPQEVAS